MNEKPLDKNPITLFGQLVDILFKAVLPELKINCE
jgi:hypothetical protein